MAQSTPKILDDLPEVRADRWWTGLDDLASRVVDVVHAVPPHVPVLLSGSWGAGKTTLLRAVAARLEEEASGAHRAVWFDAWRHETEGAMLPALVRDVWEALPESTRDKPKVKAVWRRAFRAAMALSMAALPTAAGALGGPVAQSAAKVLTLSNLEKAAQFASGEGEPPEPPEDRVAVLHRELRELVSLGWPEDECPEGPVILVDDLDRCSPAGAVRLLDQLRALLAMQHSTDGIRARFVVAMDRAVLSRAIARKFQGVGDYDGNRYLEKLFPIAFAVPVPDYRASAQLIRAFIDELELEASVDEVAAEHWRDALMVALSNSFFANPRLMKRCVNRFRLVTWFEGRATQPGRGEVGGEDGDRTLAKWIAATERWPALRLLMNEQGDDYWRRLGESLADQGKTPGPDADAVLEQRGAQAWLRREMFVGVRSNVAVFREADLRLRRWGL